MAWCGFGWSTMGRASCRRWRSGTIPSTCRCGLNSVDIKAAAGRQVEGFLDVSHFAFVHKESFGEPDNPVVPDYKVTKTTRGFVADYISSVSNYAHGYKHLAPAGFSVASAL